MTGLQAVNPEGIRAGPRPRFAASDYVRGVLDGNRVMLARAITLLESTRPADSLLARTVTSECLPHAGRSLRLAVTGAPGVGKSTLVEALGCHLLTQGRRIAVLATDPSSVRTGGSILGDKTRMPRLAADDRTFIRPSPAAGALGGVTTSAQHAILLCEAAGYDCILIETVGVGQSEVAVRSIADAVLLLVLAGAGDELQAVKRGIVETADVIAVAKADGKAVKAAQMAQRQYQRALRLFPAGPSGVRTRVVTCSALSGDGIVGLWSAVQAYTQAVRTSGYFARHRALQLRLGVRRAALDALQADFLGNPAVAARLPGMQDAVADGNLTTWDAADALVSLYRN